jgi:LssY C-terminus
VIALVALLLSCAPAGPAPAGVEIPPGTSLAIRLTSPIPRHAKVGMPLSAILIAPLALDGRLLIPAGATLRGDVAVVGDLPHAHHRSYLRPAFDTIVVPVGTTLPMETRLASVDNARETVDADGGIVGLPWLSMRPGRVETLLLLAAYAYPAAIVAVEACKLAAHGVGRVPIEYAAGTEMTLTLLSRLVVTPPPAAPPAEDVSKDADVDRLAASLPIRTEAPKFKRPSDLTNVLLVGTRDEVIQAFLAAGWTQARPFGFKTGTKAFFALARRHGYRAAPVSRLELDGAPPDIVFEKQTNTMAKRHHVRIWSRGESYHGRPLWLGAASHDISIAFDRAQRTFTHHVDGRIDREREKVMADLAFTGRAAATGLVERPAAPLRTENATGDALETDGRLGVLVLAPTLEVADR